MSSTNFISIYLPIFVVLFIIIPGQIEAFRTLIRMKKRKRFVRMTNELVKNYVGKYCKLSGGSFGTTLKGQIISINENWIEVKTNNGLQLVNSDFIQSIKVLNYQ